MPDYESPEDLKQIVCKICKKLLVWTNSHTDLFPCDCVAEADCCGVAYSVYPSGYNVTWFNMDNV